MLLSCWSPCQASFFWDIPLKKASYQAHDRGTIHRRHQSYRAQQILYYSSKEKIAKPIILWSINVPINALWKRGCGEQPSEGNHVAVKYIGEGSKWKIEKSVSWALQCTEQGVLVGRRRRCRRLAFKGFKPGITVAAGQKISGDNMNQQTAIWEFQVLIVKLHNVLFCHLNGSRQLMYVACFPQATWFTCSLNSQQFLIRAARLAHIQDFWKSTAWYICIIGI